MPKRLPYDDRSHALRGNDLKTTMLTKAHDMEQLRILQVLEQRLLTQATRQDAAEISRLIADDFVEFGASGNIWTKVDLVDRLPDESFTQRTISQFTVKPLSEQTALVTYQCSTAAGNSLRSSIWRKKNAQWQMIFHQGTPIL